ncbi:hypothetical protein ACIPYR_35070 [Streptomyces parvus]|uniref:hypothetical protein n=1 Tax=Streptomyces parvus TaxID=66428 RepID=UPI0037FD5841
MVDPTQETFSLDDCDEMRQLGREGWEKLLWDTPEGVNGPFPDPYGRGTSYYEFAGTGLYIRHTPRANINPVSAPDGFTYYDPVKDDFNYLNIASLTYVLDPKAPQPEPRKVPRTA